MYLEQWQALSGRIRGLVQTGQQLNASRNFESYATPYEWLRRNCLKTLVDLTHFRASFGNSLPPSAIKAIDTCVHARAIYSVRRLATETTPGITPQAWFQQIWAALLLLSIFETEMTFILSDVQVAIRARSERAFEHLQRLIVVDAATRQQWKVALKEGETSCEKLGAVHLLWHGIFAFKVNAAGGRTDLVFPERPVDGLGEQRYADGLILTEWKVARPDDQSHEKFAEARAQAKLYTEGVLAGVELTTVRYAVVVSSQHVEESADMQDRTVIYRHINIAVDPETPSKASRKRRRD